MLCCSIVMLAWAISLWNDYRCWSRLLKHSSITGLRHIAIKQLCSNYEQDKEAILAALADAMVDDSHEGIRFEAAFALRSLGNEAKPAIPAFAKALRDESSLVRTEAIAALHAFQSEAKPAAAALRESLNDSDQRIRDLARETLKGIPP